MQTQNEQTRLTEIFGKPMSEQEAIRMLMKDPKTWERFSQLSLEQKQPLLDFFMGRTSLLITYDTFFKRIMSPERHPERLESFLSAMLGEEIRIKDVLPRESTPFTEDGSLVILDLLVEIGGKRIVNLEMQKVGMYFPGERSEVYSSDLIMRQYTRLKEKQGKNFRYRDMSPVYILIMMDKSSGEFLEEPAGSHYLHRRQVNYDSGVQLRSLENIVYISLDTFRKKLHNKGIQTLQDAWLTFFSSVQAKDIVALIDRYPEFREYYDDIASYRRKPKEVLHMYSEMIAFLDRNTVQYMVEDMTNQLSVLKKTNEELETQNKDLESQNKDLLAEVERLRNLVQTDET